MRLQTALNKEEGEALLRLSRQIMRDPREEIRLLLRRELLRRRLLTLLDDGAGGSAKREEVGRG